MIEVQDRWVTFFPPEGAAYLIGDFTDWDDKLQPLKGAVTLEFPRGVYVEYAYFDANKQPIADPANPVRPKHPWHDFDRAVTLPYNDFKESPRPHTFRGHVYDHRMYSQTFGGQRTYYVYEPNLPPVATLYVQDGEGYYEKLCFHEVVEALLEREEIQPVRLVMIERTTVRKSTGSMSATVVPPRGNTPRGGSALWCNRGTRVVGSLTGWMVSAWLAWRNPQVFTKVGSQSGCFTADPQGGDEYHDPQWLLAPNRRFAAMLVDKGYPHDYQERPGGHNWATSKQGMEPGLKYLFERKEKPSIYYNLVGSVQEVSCKLTSTGGYW